MLFAIVFPLRFISGKQVVLYLIVLVEIQSQHFRQTTAGWPSLSPYLLFITGHNEQVKVQVKGHP